MNKTLKELADTAIASADKEKLKELFHLGLHSTDTKAGEWQMEQGFAPYFRKGPVAREITRLLYDVKLIVPFDWPNWDEGRELLSGNDLTKLEGQPKHILVGLLTALVRNDRFCEGAWGEAVESGIVRKILKELKKRLDDE